MALVGSSGTANDESRCVLRPGTSGSPSCECECLLSLDLWWLHRDECEALLEWLFRDPFLCDLCFALHLFDAMCPPCRPFKPSNFFGCILFDARRAEGPPWFCR